MLIWFILFFVNMDKEKSLIVVRTILRLLVGIMFISAAILKLLSIDLFEIYIYSFNLFSFELTTIISRLIIAAEILLGLGLVFKIYYKQAWWLSVFMIVGFSLFLIYVIIYRTDDNCHCFGELIQLNPSESIYKNIFSIIILFFIRKENNYEYGKKLRKWLVTSSIAISVILSFVVIPMDTIYNKIVSKEKNINTLDFEHSLKPPQNINLLNFETINDSLVVKHDTLTLLDLSIDQYIIGFIAAGCKYCKLGTNKLSMIFEHNNIDKKHLKLFVWGYDSSIANFVNETQTSEYEYWFIDPGVSIDITYGRFPTYVWVENGKIVDSGNLRDLEENKIVSFLKYK